MRFTLGLHKRAQQRIGRMKKHPTIKDVYATEDGRVFLEIGTSPSHGGYHYCSQIKQRRHVIVCETFHGPRPDGMVVRHLNGKHWDDRPENLIWGTQAENCQDTVRHGNSTQGRRNAQAKLGPDDVMEIRNRWAAGESPTLLASEYGVKPPSIHDMVRGRTWTHLPLTKRRSL